MKLIAMLGAGVLAAGTLAAVPAEAQRYGGHHGYYGHHDGYDYGYRGGRYGYRNAYRPHGFRGGYRRGYYGRPRVVCRLHRGYYGPVRRCFRAY